jgi:uncharacterized repeat protein (TIGR03803 family)
MRKIGWKTAWAVSVMCAITAIVSPAQTFTTLHSFEGRDGQYPYAGLVQATVGSLDGITADGGGDGGGTVFKISPNGAMTTLYRFCAQPGCADGKYPLATPIQAPDGSLYRTTNLGGANDDGTVFEIARDGMLTTLYVLRDNCLWRG